MNETIVNTTLETIFIQTFVTNYLIGYNTQQSAKYLLFPSNHYNEETDLHMKHYF